MERARLTGWSSWRGCLALAVLSALGLAAAPPEYKSFRREQRIAYAPDEDSLLRIWAIYVGQGDALLVQFPKKFRAPGTGERIEMLIDGGPSGAQLRVFLRALSERPGMIEHVVITHHDADHIAGLTALLKKDDFGVGTIYHNGLASWKLGGRGFPLNQWPSSSAAAVYHSDGVRGMGLLEPGTDRFRRISLIENLSGLRASVTDFVKGYGELADAIVNEAQPAPVAGFPRTELDDPGFRSAASAGSGDGALRIEPLWPLDPPRRYNQWSETINGNSVAFRLVYGDFSMLFTGDQNELSERALLDRLTADNRLDDLRADVLKVPHHGSRHGIEAFFDAVAPVVSVASMGGRGFTTSWKHPSLEVIRWLHGAHRVYHTYIHERKFKYADLRNKVARAAMVEKKHVLIETDGKWFRVVEVENPADGAIPRVEQVRRGDGTRWINAKEQ